MNKKIFLSLICFYLSSNICFSQKTDYLLDTVIIKGYQKDFIVNTIKASKIAFGKQNIKVNNYQLQCSTSVDDQPVVSVNIQNLQLKKKNKLNFDKKFTGTAFKGLHPFEIGLTYNYESTLGYLLNYSKHQWMNNFNLFSYKMREIDGLYQITCYSENGNSKSVIILNKETLLPLSIYKTNIRTVAGTQIYENLEKGVKSKVSFNVFADQFTINYKYSGDEYALLDLKSNWQFNEYHISRINKKDESKIMDLQLTKVNSEIKLME